jgi:hypothetical protein
MSFSDSADMLARVVRSSVRRCASKAPLCVDITGGNDSRLTAAALEAEGIADRAIFRVVESTDNLDGEIGKKIAAMLGARIICQARHEGEVKVESFARFSTLMDGNWISLTTARRMLSDRGIYADFDFHLGSLGGELARDFSWSHEYIRFWSPRAIDFNYLLRRRLYVPWKEHYFQIAGVPIERRQHDDYLLAPIHSLAEHMDGVYKPYILDCFYLHRLSRKTATLWAHAPSKTVLLPFLSSEFLDVAMGAPWWQRAGRRLMLAALARIDRRMCELPHDTGVTMRPLTLTSCGAHIISFLSEVHNKVVMRGVRGASSGLDEEVLSGDLVARSIELTKQGCLPEPVARLIKWLGVEGSPPQQVAVLPGLIGMGELLNAYKGISRDMEFDHEMPNPVTGEIVLQCAF